MVERKQIKLPRDFVEWQWWDEKGMNDLFIYLLLSAKQKPSEQFGQNLKIGELLTTLSFLSNKLGLTMGELRLRLSKLKRTGYIKTRATNNYTVISICNFDTYLAEEV